MAEFQLENEVILGDFKKPYLVAEMNSSHGGDIEQAKEMIRQAKAAGCGCVKFQSWSTETLYSGSYYKENRMAKKLIHKLSLTKEQQRELAIFAKEQEVAFASTPYSEEEAKFLVQECQVPFLKISSMELNNYHFLRFLAEQGVPMVLSTGMGTFEEIEQAVAVIEKAGNRRLCILHCVSEYPAPPEHVNLNNIRTLRERFPQYPIGYSDHTLGTEAAVAATALGAALIEKHFTLNRTAVGMDNQMAAEPEDMQALADACFRTYRMLGSGERSLSAEELVQRNKMRRSVIVTKDLPEGAVLTETDLSAKRPGTGIPADRLDALVGKRLKKAVTADCMLEEEVVE